MSSPTSATRFTRIRRVCLSIVVVVAALIGVQLAAQLLNPYLRSAVGEFFPNYVPRIYRDMVATLLLVASAFLLGWRKEIGLCWPRNSRGLIALGIVVCYLTAVTGCFKEYSLSNITLHLVFFVLLDQTFNAAWEEMFFRGFSLRILRPCGVVGSIMVSSVLFALIHSVGDGDAFSVYQRYSLTFAFGLVFCVSRLQSDSLAPPIVAHCLINGLHRILGGSEADAETSFQLAVALLMPIPLLVYGFCSIWKNHSGWEENFGDMRRVEPSEAS